MTFRPTSWLQPVGWRAFTKQTSVACSMSRQAARFMETHKANPLLNHPTSQSVLWITKPASRNTSGCTPVRRTLNTEFCGRQTFMAKDNG